MHKLFAFLLATIVFTIHVNAQEIKSEIPQPPPALISSNEEEKNYDDSPFTNVEVEAEFPGGASEWKKYLQKNLNASVPLNNRARRGQYMVVIRFIVAKDGSISEVVAETNHGYGMEKEVVRVIKMGPKWKPAMQNGSVVRAYRRQPVTFLIE